MRHRDRTALEKIFEVIEETEKIFAGTSLEDFLKNSERKLAMTMSILRVGELVKNLTIEFRDLNPQVKWKAIAGFRDVIAHKYDILDMQEVYKTIKYEFPELKLQIEKILDEDK
ncbi:MAG: DUF86 domain-containing protein [Selenomonadaceae bacterium]|nr:DUF86 domain-containing protein [Selenomonadaceae bacterium]